MEASPYAIPSRKLTMWLFIISDAVTFGAFLFSYGYLRVATPNWTRPFETGSVINVIIMTVVLVTSSLTMLGAVDSVKVGDKVFADLVWTYPDPIAECPKIKGYLCFFNEQVDEIRVDGVPVARPITPWSKDWKEKAATVPDSRGPVDRP